MKNLKTEEEIEKLRNSSLLVSKTLGFLREHVIPGMTTQKLDKMAEEFIRDRGGRPAFKGYHPAFSPTPFPATLCTSVNKAVVHGLPTNEPLKEGDLVSLDCGVELEGYYGDSAFTYAVGQVSDENALLMKVTRESLEKGIEQAIVGNRVGDISAAIQEHVEAHGFSIVRELVGHGIGTSIHEPPEIPNFGRKGSGKRLKEGMVICIEPMVNAGKAQIRTAKDGWTIETRDGSLSAHYEHAVVIRKNKAEVLSTFDYCYGKTKVD